MSQERITILSRGEREYEKDVEKRSDIPDMDNQPEKSCEERKFWKVIHDILVKQKEPYEWYIDEIADELGLDEHGDIKYLKEVMEDIAMDQDSPIVSTTQNYTKFVYKERGC